MNCIWVIEIFSRGKWMLLCTPLAHYLGNRRADMRSRCKQLKATTFPNHKLRVAKYVPEVK